MEENDYMDDFIANKIRSSQQIKTLCDHCGNISFKDRTCSDRITQDEDNTTFTTDEVYRCTICNEIILIRTIHQLPDDYVGSKQLHHRFAGAKFTEEKQLWPTPLSLPPEVPDRVRKLYEDARLVKRVPSAFVVQIGRALEAITKDKNAQGRTLNNKLDWLIAQDFLPQIFGQMGHINRILRNWGAHDTEIDVELEDMEIVDEFFRAIVEYLYIAPAKVNKVQDLINHRQSRS